MAKKRKPDQVSAEATAQDAPQTTSPEPSTLTWEEEKFCHEYLRNGGNGAQAYRAARPGASAATAKCMARHWLSTKLYLSEYLTAERERLSHELKIEREDIIRLLVAQVFTEPAEVIKIMEDPSNKQNYVGLAMKSKTLTIEYSNEYGWKVSTMTPSERRAAANELWQKLGLDKTASDTDRISFLERFANLGSKLNRSGSGGGSSGGEGP